MSRSAIPQMLARQGSERPCLFHPREIGDPDMQYLQGRPAGRLYQQDPAFTHLKYKVYTRISDINTCKETM
jgi:hypothetical protein